MRHLSLKKNEQVVRVVRRYVLTYFVGISFASLFIGSAFFFLFWFFRHGVLGQMAFVILLFSGLCIVSRLLFMHFRNVCYVTTHRIVDIDQRGVFHCVISDIPYDQIEDVSGRMTGFFETIFRFGDVRIQTGGGTVRIVVDRVKYPARLQRLVNDMRERYIERGANVLDHDAVDAWIEGADGQEVKRLEELLAERKKAMRL